MTISLLLFLVVPGVDGAETGFFRPRVPLMVAVTRWRGAGVIWKFASLVPLGVVPAVGGTRGWNAHVWPFHMPRAFSQHMQEWPVPRKPDGRRLTFTGGLEGTEAEFLLL